MIGDRELWACANEVLRQHGAEASRHVDERCTALAAAGKWDGYFTWVAIGRRLRELARVAASPGELQ